jgi:hypothetical protein
MMAQLGLARKFLKVLFLVFLLLWACHALYNNKAVGFSPYRITSDFTFNPDWETAPLSPQDESLLEHALSQPFYYLSAGTQSYAFQSQDGQYVIKFFRMKHKLFHIKDLWKKGRDTIREKKLYSIYSSYKLAYDVMKDDAALIYLHFNKTSHLQKKLKLIDFLHRSHWIDLDQIEFVLQHKANLLKPTLKQYLKHHQLASFDEDVLKIQALIDKRRGLGIADRDKGIDYNYGFVKGRAVQLDVGRLYIGERPFEKEKILSRIASWKEDKK